MPTPLVLDVQTNIAQGKAGLDQVTAGISNVDKQAKKTTDTTMSMAGSLEGIAKRTERGIGRFVFRDMAMSALNARSTMSGTETAVSAATIGLEAMGRTAMMVSGNIGFLVLAGVAAVSIFKKMQQASGETTEAFKKSVDGAAQNSLAYRSAADSLQSLGIIDDETHKQLLRNSKEQRKIALWKIDDVKQEIKAKRDLLQADLDAAKAELVKQQIAVKNLSFRSEAEKQAYVAARQSAIQTDLDAKRALSIGDLTKELEKLSAVEGALKAMNEASKVDTAASDERRLEVQRLMNEGLMQMVEDTHSMTDATMLQKEAQDQLNVALAEYMVLLSRGTQAEIEAAKKRVDGLKAVADGWTQTAKKIETSEQQKAAKLGQINSMVFSSMEVVNGKILLNARKAIGNELKSFADAEAKKLELKAIAAWPNFAMAAVYAGLALAVRGAGATAAAAIEAGGQSGGGGATAAGGAATSQESTDSTKQAQQKSVTIVVQSMHVGSERSLAQYLGKLLNTEVETGDMEITSTKIVASGDFVPG